MDEKEKMLKGLAYQAFKDKKLFEDRIKAKDLCYEFNSLKPSQIEERKTIIRKLFGKIKGDFNIESNFFCDYGYNIEIGENFYINHNCVMLDCNKITFGDNVLIGPNCNFFCAIHPLDTETRNSGLEYALPITVGDNVWFGGNVTVLPNVKIGSDTVIGAGSVVTKDIPSGVVAIGNPCKVLRKITEVDKNKY